MIDDVLKDAARRMDKSVEATRHEFTTIRTGRASAALLERINVSAYGTKMPINQLATISVPEPRLLTITPFDKGVMRDIEKAILESDLGLTPNTAGTVIRINIPALTEERRRELSKHVHGEGENAKIAIRNVRRDANKHADGAQKDGELSEDGCKGLKDEVQELTKKFENSANDLANAKEAEVMGG
jgi:ribosome recycling factor